MSYILGIDQGGSKTHVIIGDTDGNILGLGVSYGACHSVNGLEYAIKAVKLAAEIALSQAKITIEDVQAIYAGMTGVDWEFEGDLLREKLSLEFKVTNIHVVNDCIIAMRSGTNLNYSCVLCAGSGLNCAIKKDDIEFVYGFYIDEMHQGGVAIFERAIKAVFDSELGLSQQTILTQKVFNHFNVKNADELLYKKVTGKLSSKDMLYLPIIVEEAALANDMIALKLLYDYGTEISQYAIAGMKKFDMLNMEVEIVLSGSVFKCVAPIFKDAIVTEIHKHAIHAKIVDALYEPVVGALLLSLDLVYDTINDDILSNLEVTASKFNLKRI